MNLLLRLINDPIFWVVQPVECHHLLHCGLEAGMTFPITEKLW